MKKGKLIVIEGTDGSGKTVQAGLLLERLLNTGYQVQMTDFPQYGKSFFANMIGKYLKGEFGWPQELRDHLKKHPLQTEQNPPFPDGKIKNTESNPDEVNPYLASLLYAGDRWEAKKQMDKWLVEGRVIISNRYVCSNMAHQGAKIRGVKEREEFFTWIEALEHNVYAIPRTDLTIYLHVPIEISQELIKTRAKQAHGIKSEMDVHEEDREYLKRVQDTYIYLSERETNWCTINCTENNQIKSREAIAEEVWNIVSKRLS